MSTTAIEWTDATWNPTVGCDRISPGCANCYAKTLHDKRHAALLAGKKMAPQYAQPFEVLQLMPDRLDAPLRRSKPTMYFVNSVSDLFHEDVPDQFLVDVFGIMALAHWHTFQVLTKRPERMRAFLAAGDHGILRQFMLLQQNGGISTRPVFRALDIKRRDDVEWRWPLPNVWLGVSVENQHFADERIPLLLQTPAAVRFISAEPLLEQIDLRCIEWLRDDASDYFDALTRKRNPYDDIGLNGAALDWVIIGGESGYDARPFRVQWARAILAQCRAAGVPCFVKQLGSHLIDDDIPGPRINPETGARTLTVRQTLTIRDRKGGDMAEWPEDLRVREFPKVGQ